MIDENQLEVKRASWARWPGYESNGFKDVLDTLEKLWRIARTGSNIEDILEVPPLLGHESSEVIRKAIQDFRDALKAVE